MAGADAVVYGNMAVLDIFEDLMWFLFFGLFFFLTKSFMSTWGLQSFSFPV